MQGANSQEQRAGLHPYREYWLNHMSSHPDDDFVDKLMDHIDNGVNIGYKGPILNISSHNWPSSKKFEENVDNFITENIQFGSIEGPLESLSDNYRSSPIGAFEKRRGKKVRIIHDLSWPPGASVNDHINKQDFRVTYTNVDEAVKLCELYEQPWLCKTDLKSAYLSCLVREKDRDLLGFRWGGPEGTEQSYRYASLPFGLRSACSAFNDLANGLQFMIESQNAPCKLTHYLDDFFLFLKIIAQQKHHCHWL